MLLLTVKSYTSDGLAQYQETMQSTGRPVRLKLARINGYDLKVNEYAHGCWVEEGVYAVTDIVIIKDNTLASVKCTGFNRSTELCT